MPLDRERILQAASSASISSLISGLIHTFMLSAGPYGLFILTIYNLIANHGIKVNKKKTALKEVISLLSYLMCKPVSLLASPLLGFLRRE